MLNSFKICAILVGLLLSGFSTAYAAPSLSAFEGVDIVSAKKIQVRADKSSRGLVVVFLSAQCPCSNSHVAELKKLAESYKDFTFTAVHSNADEPPAMTLKYFKDAQLPFSVIQDDKAQIANVFKANRTPHAFIVSPQGTLVYQGGVTNSAVADKADQNYLKNALNDITQIRPVQQARTRTLGCAINRGE